MIVPHSSLVFAAPQSVQTRRMWAKTRKSPSEEAGGGGGSKRRRCCVLTASSVLRRLPGGALVLIGCVGWRGRAERDPLRQTGHGLSGNVVESHCGCGVGCEGGRAAFREAGADRFKNAHFPRPHRASACEHGLASRRGTREATEFHLEDKWLPQTHYVQPVDFNT